MDRARVLGTWVALAAGVGCQWNRHGAGGIGAAPDSSAGASPGEELALAPTTVLDATQVLDRVVKDGRGAAAGRIEDLLVDWSDGTVSCVVVTREAGGVRRERVLDCRELAWAAAPQGVCTTERSAAELWPDTAFPLLFEGQEPVTVAGEAIAVEVSGGDLVVKLRDEQNRLYRVLVEAAALVQRCVSDLDVGARLRVEGVLTRDAAGKLLVAGSLATETSSVVLRNADGELQWRAPCGRLRSAREVVGREIGAAAGAGTAIEGWILDPARGVITDLRIVDVDGVQRVVPLRYVRLDPASGTWILLHDEGGPRELAAPMDGAVGTDRAERAGAGNGPALEP